MISRRNVLKTLTSSMAAAPFLTSSDLFAKSPSSGFKIGACDWSIGQRGKIEALEVGKRIGLDGVQISLGDTPENMHLLQTETQQAYKEAAKKHGIALGGIAIGAMNEIPYKSDPRAEEWVAGSIDAAQALDCKVILLAFFANGDIKNDAKGQKVVIERLKKVAPKAEKAGVMLGLETWLSAEEHMAIIDAVGSPNVQVYYDVANSNKMGYNIYEEIRWLGKKGQICELHMKENGYLLGKGLVDFKEVRKAIDDIGYEGWMQIEGAVPEGADMFESYVHNEAYLRSLFPERS
jgi:L-ribulose-5-phosphate 3-epimerase